MTSKERDIGKINLKKYSTIQKILLLQRLLKEMTSIKQRFKGNKNKMLQKLDKNCINYYKKKIYMKEIFDFCTSTRPEERIEYILIEDAKNCFNESYQALYDFYFLIRKDYSLMLKIIELSEKYGETLREKYREDLIEELNDFLVNFLYGNTIKSSFSDEELMIMIYLLLEKFILINLPDKIDINNNILSYLQNNFLFCTFRALTRKIDLRNFLYTILSDFILRLENLSIPLSIDKNVVNRYLTIDDRKIYLGFMKNLDTLEKEKGYKRKKTFKTIVDKNEGFFKRDSSGSLFLRRASKIKLGSSVMKPSGNNNDNNDDNNNDNNNNNNDEKDSKQKSNALDDILNIPETIAEEAQLEDDKNKNLKKFEKRKTDIKDNDLNIDSNLDKFEKINDNDLDLKASFSAFKKKNDIDEEEIEEIEENEDIDLSLSKTKSSFRKKEDLDKKGKVKIDNFFEFNSITEDKLKKELSKYENKKDDKFRINSAMKEYLNILISQIKDEEENNNKNKDKELNNIDNIYEDSDDDDIINDKEIFSNSLIIKELKEERRIKQSHSFSELMKKMKNNYRIITRIILDIINKLKENLISSPYSLKCICKFINILLNKKYNELAKNNLSDYQIFMFKVNILIGKIILPILTNPDINGIIYTNVISEMTRETLKMISNIIETMVTGKLFNKKDNRYMTVFNKFILETIPQLFELIENIEKNFELPENINNLISTYHNSSNINKGSINYDYFKENPNENINYQSICFSLKNMFFILQIIMKYKTLLIDENQNDEQKLILQKFLDNEKSYNYLLAKGMEKKKNEFYYITKITYPEIFEKRINEIIRDNFIYVIPKKNDDFITAFKKCLNEVLNYANKIQIESFYELTERKDEKALRLKKIKNSNKEKEEKNNEEKDNLKKKKKPLNSLKQSLIKITVADKEEDADFKNVLFPQIKKNINSEINYNVNNDMAQRIIYCTNFLNLYMKKIPEKYKENNYSLLFDELINETKDNIEYLKTNVLFEFYKKIKEAEKLYMMNLSYSSQVENLERSKITEYLYNKLLLPPKIKIKKDSRNIITNMEYEKDLALENDDLMKEDNDIDFKYYFERKKQNIKIMISEFPDFHQYEEEYDNILDIEEKAFTPDAINEYFSVIKKLVKKEKIIKRYNKEDLHQILYDLENYILSKLYDKLFPFESTKEDVFIYKKCKRLGFIKPENIVKDKNVINEKLCEEAIHYFDNLDEKITPMDKIKTIGKAFNIIQQSITFSAGKDKLGTDDLLDPLLYIIIKSKPKNIISNYKYCELYLNSDLSKKQYGLLLTQFYTVTHHIKKMKYTDLIGISEKEFGEDEME